MVAALDAETQCSDAVTTTADELAECTTTAMTEPTTFHPAMQPSQNAPNQGGQGLGTVAMEVEPTLEAQI
jgi:hypothetical protein